MLLLYTVLLVVGGAVVVYQYFYRYVAWLLSWILSRYCRLRVVRIGTIGFLRVSNIKFALANGLVVEIHGFRVSSSFFNQEYRRPIMFLIDDLRVESESNDLKSAKSYASQLRSRWTRSTQPTPQNPENRAWRIQFVQYFGAKVNTSNVVLLDVIQDCLLHLTLDTLSIETYLDREGLQIEVVCKLVQAKLFLRKKVDAMLLDITLAGSASVDIADGPGIQPKCISVSLKNPRISASDGLVDYLITHRHQGSSRDTTPSTHSPEEAAEGEKASVKAQLIAKVKETRDISLDVSNLSIHFMAALNVQSPRTISLTVSSIQANAEALNRTGAIKIADCAVVDHTAVSYFKGKMFSAKIEPVEPDALGTSDDDDNDDELAFRVGVETIEPFVVLYQHDLTWWIVYTRNPQFARLFTTTNVFTDDFSSMDFDEKPTTPLISKSGLKWAIEAELTDFQCQLRNRDGSAVVFGIDFATLILDSGLQDVEFGVTSLWCHQMALDAAATAVNERLSLEFQQHAWGTAVAIGAGLALFKQRPEGRLLAIQLDECQLEWEEQVVTLITEFVESVLRKDDNSPSTAPTTGPPVHEEDKWSTIEEDLSQNFVIQVSAEKVDLFFTAKRSAFIAFKIINWRIETSSKPKKIQMSLEHVVLAQGELDLAKSTTLPLTWPQLPPMELKRQYAMLRCGGCDRFVVRYVAGDGGREFMMRFEASLQLIWSPLAYVVFYDVYKKVREVISRFSVKPKSPSQKPSHPLLLTLHSDHQVEFAFRLPRDHYMEWVVPCIRFQKMGTVIDVIAPKYHLSMDDHIILMLENPQIRRLASDTRMDMGRQEFSSLRTRSNRIWSWTADVMEVVFPYQYDFAAAYDEVINSVKWIKLVHGHTPRPFTADSPLPCDLVIAVKSASMQLNDDPFESQLQTIYEVMMDEVFERERRRQILEEKVAELQRENPLFPKAKIDALYQILVVKDAQIYADRIRKVQQAHNRQLLHWALKDFELRAFADQSLHGKDNVARFMAQVNPESDFNPDAMDFSTMWLRAFELDVAESVQTFRDYPLPYARIKEAHFLGTIAGAEHAAGDRSTRQAVVDLPQPWGRFVVNRNMCPLKFYYDMGCEITSFTTSYGPCWEPCLSMISLCWNYVNSPSRDPSPPLPFWDKVRLLFHGRFSMICQKLTTSMLASPDPYNETELMDIVWNNYELDWVTGQIRIQSEIRARVRTASKYDDSELLHLPTFKCSIDMEWACSGSPYDHHAVVAVAPNKLPEYSTNTQHDSFRCFRSSHVDIAMTIDVKVGPEDEFSPTNVPQVTMYANTVKWFDFVKNTLMMVNRPVKRGSLFGTTNFKKQQFSRHFRRVRLNVNLPRFMISYWMSYSETSHGLRMFCNSLQLLLEFELQVTERPSKDQVRRRAKTEWKTSVFNLQLENAQLRLYSEKKDPCKDDLNPSLEDTRAYFIGLSRMSYERHSENATILDASAASPAVHHITVHDLRAAWTVENRDTCLAIMEGIQKARLLRKILSTDALASLDVFPSLGGDAEGDARAATARDRSESGEHGNLQGVFSVNLDDTGADSMLKRLIDEAGTNPVAYSEETIESPKDLLLGAALTQMNDVVFRNWQIDLLNSQALLNGDKTNSFIVMTAAQASVTQLIHKSVWRNAQLLAKKSWTATLTDMQYFAPCVVLSSIKRDQFRWLSSDIIDKEVVGGGTSITTNSKINTYARSGHDLKGVVNVFDENGTPTELQLQRVGSRCSCQIFFVTYSDFIDESSPTTVTQVKDAPTAVWGCTPREDIDCFTLKHNMLQVSTSSQQFQLLLDILNNLVFFVDPKKKQTESNRRLLWFRLKKLTKEEVRESIAAMQSELRSVVTVLRSLERQAYFLNKDPASLLVDVSLQALRSDIDEYKVRQLELIDTLAMTISCYKEREILERSVELKSRCQREDELPVIARRFEVYFENCNWQLTYKDMQSTLAELQIRNFFYNRTARVDNSGEHLLEVGLVKVINHIQNSPYRDVLARLPQIGPNLPPTVAASAAEGVTVTSAVSAASATTSAEDEKMRRTPDIRVICRDLPPVGGICVREHFEVNIVPMHAQVTHRFYNDVIHFFFPELSDAVPPASAATNGTAGPGASGSTGSTGPSVDPPTTSTAEADYYQTSGSLSLKRRLRTAVNDSFRSRDHAPISANTGSKKGHAGAAPGEIDKMKERAEKNSVFNHIIVPQVTFVVSYKGRKEKNIMDVDRVTFTLPVCEYFEKNWTWLDLANAIQQQCKTTLLQQFVRQKILRSGDKAALSTVQPVDEEQKKRIVLGTPSADAKTKKKSGRT